MVVTRRSSGSDAAAAPPATPVAASSWVTVGSTSDYDSPAPAPLQHSLLVLLWLAAAVVPVPPSLNIVATASLAVLVGSLRSAKEAPPSETMTRGDAMRFPVFGSAMLFSLFLCFKYLPKDLVNLVLTGYFAVLGVLAVAVSLAPFVAARLPRHLASRTLSLGTLRPPAWLSEEVELVAAVPELAGGVAAAALCAWYCAEKHWLANNALGLAFSLQGIENLSLGSVQVGALLLAGLFVYDIFWVFCTPVMVSVAKAFDAPIKLLFPRPAALAAAAAAAADSLPPKQAFNMLGLGDIVIPGIFVALILRLDLARAKAAREGTAPAPRARYFRAALGGYVAGLGTTIGVMNLFSAAQPALLYIVPAVLGAVAAAAAAAGEVREVLAWEEGEGAAKEEWVDVAKEAKKAK